jgi:cell division protein FtsB
MNRYEKRRAPSRRLVWQVSAVLGGGFLLYYMIFSSNGLLAWHTYQQQVEQRQAALTQLQKKRDALANRAALLDPKHANADMVGELVRKNLGVVDKNEIVVPLDAGK